MNKANKNLLKYATLFLIMLIMTAAFSAVGVDFNAIETMVMQGNLQVKANLATIASLNATAANLNSTDTAKNNAAVEAMEKQGTELVKAGKELQLMGTSANEKLLGVALESSGTTMITNAKTTKAQIPTPDALERSRATVYKAIAQLEGANCQIVYGAQSVFLGYHKMDRSLRELEQSEILLARSVEVYEVMLEAGTATQTDYDNNVIQFTTIKDNMDSIRYEMQNLCLDLGDMLGQNSMIEPGTMPNYDSLGMPSVQQNLQVPQLVGKNYNVIAARYTVVTKTFKEPTIVQMREYDAAAIAAMQAERAVRLAFEKTLNSAKGKELMVNSAKKALDQKQKGFKAVNAKFDAGKLSRTDAIKGEIEMLKAAVALEGARADLFAAMLKYQWLTRGVTLQ